MILIANMICDCRFVSDTGCPGFRVNLMKLFTGCGQQLPTVQAGGGLQ